MVYRKTVLHICLMALITDAYASRILSPRLPVLPIDGLGTQVPSTTDFPAPQTTDVNSDISNAYQLYLQHCGPPMQDAQQGAIAEYKLDQNKDPDDPSGQDFSAWAYTHILSYRNSYQLCVNGENKYKDLLATFVPDKPTSTSGPGEQAAESGQPSSSGSGPSTNSDDTGKGQGTKGSNGRVNSDVPKFIGIISSLLTAQMLLV